MASKPIFIFIICLLFFPLLIVTYGLTTESDTLNQGDIFNSTDRLVSRNGLFTLGFSGSYLVINYTNEHPVWSANRNTPILENSGTLTIDNQTGRFIIMDKNGKSIELYPRFSSNKPIRNLSAILQDDGNFVLKEINSADSQQLLWQSFDYPTDTLLVGMKLGVNHKTGMKWMLRSWKSDDNPSDGGFTLEWDPKERQLIMKRNEVVSWTSGVLNASNRFGNFPVFDQLNQNYHFRSFSKDDEEYLTYSFQANSWKLEEERNVSKWYLDDRGNIKDISGRLFILSSAVCDGYRTESGCKKWEVPSCRRDGAAYAERVGYFVNGLQHYDNTSFIDCQDLCWKNCDCNGFRLYPSGSGCILYGGRFYNENLIGSEAISHYIIIPGPPRKVNRTWIWIVTSILLGLIAMSMGIFLYLRWRRLRLEAKFLEELMTFDTAKDIAELENGRSRGPNNLQIYSVETIKAATNGFSLHNKLGQGGFGPVYKGRLKNGQEIAVKTLSSTSGQGLVEFKNELMLIAKLQHMNLVRLLGFCIHGEEKMLVYEYMPNKSLDFFIFGIGDQSRRELLDWNKRFSIIEGIAQGLLYLHKYSRLRIIHRDLKVSNILLDKEMNPKISDFGLARIFKGNESETNTCTVVGTRGYMSPEYIMEGRFSVKSDVYSFGVLVLEIISGRKNHSVYDYDHPLNLVGYAWESWKRDDALEILEPTLGKSAIKEQVMRCINVGLLCVEQNPKDRPTMADVLSMLTSEIMELPMPKQPAFYTGRSSLTENSSQKEIEVYTINSMSFSVMDGR